jgi:hypothetical protein
MGTIRIGSIQNYYGGLYVVEKDGKYYWDIENYNTDYQSINNMQEIPKYLHDALIKFETECEKS